VVHKKILELGREIAEESGPGGEFRKRAGVDGKILIAG